MIVLKLSLPYWLRRVHIADNIRKPSEVLRKFLAGSKDSFLSIEIQFCYEDKSSYGGEKSNV
jgi:hypothetical protein